MPIVKLKLDDQVIACAWYVCRVMETYTKDQEVGGLISGPELISLKLYNQGKSCACVMPGSDTFKVVK